MSTANSPVRAYRTTVLDSGNGQYTNRIMIGTAATGLVRVEWVAARYGQIIPTNWSHVQVNQYVNGYYPLRYQVADAQNLIAAHAINLDFEWLLLYEHDVIPPPDAFIRINDYIRSETYPVVSGLYYTRSIPSEPLVYRGRGTSYYDDFRIGDLVWADGVPTGFLLIHMGIIRAMALESEEYQIGKTTVRRVFDTPRLQWVNPERDEVLTYGGTSDLAWCSRVMDGKYFSKSGWDSYQNKQYPFLVDTNLNCKHINPDGQQFP